MQTLPFVPDKLQDIIPKETSIHEIVILGLLLVIIISLVFAYLSKHLLFFGFL